MPQSFIDVCPSINKALCGLICAPRPWGQHLAEVAKAGSLRLGEEEQGVHCHPTEGKSDGILLACVDDDVATRTNIYEKPC